MRGGEMGGGAALHSLTTHSLQTNHHPYILRLLLDHHYDVDCCWFERESARGGQFDWVIDMWLTETMGGTCWIGGGEVWWRGTWLFIVYVCVCGRGGGRGKIVTLTPIHSLPFTHSLSLTPTHSSSPANDPISISCGAPSGVCPDEKLLRGVLRGVSSEAAWGQVWSWE